MKKVQYTFEGTEDSTGYLFSLVKCLSAALRCSRYCEYADRMWGQDEIEVQ